MSGESIRDVTIRVSIKQIQGEPLKVPDLREISKGVKDAAQDMRAVAQETAKVKSNAAAAANEIERLKKLDEVKLQSLEVADKFKATGEAAFTMARGAAFLFSSTDEGFAEMAANVAKVQGGFDLFKGSFESVKNLTEGMVKLKAITGATTAYTALQTGATLGLTAALNTAKAAAIGMYVALGPIGAAALAVAAAGTAVYLAWKWFTSPAPANAFLITKQRLLENAEAAGILAGKMADLQAVQHRAKSSAANLDKQTEALKAQATLTKKTFDETARLNTVREKSKNLLSDQEAAAMILTAHSKETAKMEQEGVTIGQARLEFQTRMVELEQRQLETAKARGDELKNQKTTEESLLKTAQEKIKAEKDALLSAEAKFGQLTRREQSRVQDIAARGGPQSKKEAELVSKAGFDQSATGFFAQRGRDAGFNKASQALGGKTDSDLKKLEQERSQIEDRLQGVKDRMAINQKRQLDLLDGVLTELEKQGQVESRLAELERKLLMRKAREEASRK